MAKRQHCTALTLTVPGEAVDSSRMPSDQPQFTVVRRKQKQKSNRRDHDTSLHRSQFYTSLSNMNGAVFIRVVFSFCSRRLRRWRPCPTDRLAGPFSLSGPPAHATHRHRRCPVATSAVSAVHCCDHHAAASWSRDATTTGSHTGGQWRRRRGHRQSALCS